MKLMITNILSQLAQTKLSLQSCKYNVSYHTMKAAKLNITFDPQPASSIHPASPDISDIRDSSPCCSFCSH